MKAEARQRYLVLTCDSEAVPGAVPDHHVDRLIWGRFPDAPYEAGIAKMMDIADEFGMKMVFFHDVLERSRYGEETDRAARYIIERGHDLQLHLHVEFLPPDFWTQRGFHHVTWAMNLYSEQAARYVMEYGVELFERMTGQRPIAYRAGAVRYNASILRALAGSSIPLSFQYHPATPLKAAYPHGFDAGVLPLFRWSNGVIEVPVGVHENLQPRGTLPRYKGFELHELLGGVPQAQAMLNRYWSLGPGYDVFVMLLHSWSFLYRDDSGHYVWKDTKRVTLFREILASLPGDVRVISARELLTELAHRRLAPTLEIPLQVAGTEAVPLSPLAAEPSSDPSNPQTLRGMPPPAKTSPHP